MTQLVELDAFTVRFPDFTLGPLDLALAAGERVALVGPNGAGKTTAMLAIGGRRGGYSGTVRFRGRDLQAQLPEARAEIGLLNEDAPAYPWMTVAEHLALTSAFHPTWDRDYATRLLSTLGVDQAARMGTLSKGTRVKAAFVAAEAARPPLLVLDEPTSGLDPVVRRALLDAVNAAVPRGGDRTVVLSTHLLEDVEHLADRVLVLRSGTLVADVGLDALRSNAPRQSVAAQLHDLLANDSGSPHDLARPLSYADAA